MEEWVTYLGQKRSAFLNDLIEILKIPSVSTDPAHREDVRKAARWVKGRLKRAGIKEVQLMETGGHPIVYGERFESEEKKTVLFYGHFDVQPPEPLELWNHPPFEPHIEDGFLFARGASDMKANVLLPIIACEALLNSSDTLPFNVKFLFEGEEELGSPSLGQFIQDHRSMLSCDLVVSADGGIGSPENPTLNLSYRGLVGVELKVQTAGIDVHSGLGGYVPNALHGLVTILDALRDSEGRILVEGFYDDVDPISEVDKKIIKENGQIFDQQMRPPGMKASFGEPEYSPFERMAVRPTLEINGVWGGFQGSGVKTVIPQEAFAKITCRLVGHQNPKTIREGLKATIKKVAPEYTEVTIKDLPGEGFPYRLPPEHGSVKALKSVIERTDKKLGFGFVGGTVPVMGLLKRALNAETITVGAAEPGQNAHAPNEFIRLANFERLQNVYCDFLTELEAML